MRVTYISIIFLCCICLTLLQSYKAPWQKGSENFKAGIQEAISMPVNDSSPILRIGHQTKQPIDMFSLQIPERSIFIQTYASATGGQIIFDIFCKRREQLDMRLLKQDDSLATTWTKKVTIKGYKRQSLDMDNRAEGKYKLRIFSNDGKLLKHFRIIKGE